MKSVDTGVKEISKNGKDDKEICWLATLKISWTRII